jgi:hypothetical protein
MDSSGSSGTVSDTIEARRHYSCLNLSSHCRSWGGGNENESNDRDIHGSGPVKEEWGQLKRVRGC